MRINQFIASSTRYSRRKAEELVKRGDVLINGLRVESLATEVKDTDEIFLGGQKITPAKKVYYLLNKPAGYTSTTSDPHAERIITDLVPSVPAVFPVGRLDKQSRGLIILTNDGALAQRLTHPKFAKEKEYLVETSTELTDEQINSLRKGVTIEEKRTAPSKITKLGSTKYLFVITEGRNRQIRKMISSVGAEVLDLERIRIGNITAKNLKEGDFRILNSEELREI